LRLPLRNGSLREESIVRRPSRAWVAGALAAYADGFGVLLADQGYTPSSVQDQLRLMGI
jgi:hypothetical protein